MKTRDDELIAALGQAARELDVPADRRWDALSAGDLSAEDAAALEAIAAGSDEGREAYEAFRPIDEAGRAKTADAVIAALGAPAGDAKETARSPANDVVPPAKRRRFLPALLAAASLAAAAAIAVSLRPGAAALPGYSLVIAGEREDRADPTAKQGVARLGPGAVLKLVLRPERAVEGPVAVRGFLAREGKLSAWSAPVEIAPEGTVRISGTREALFAGLPAGAYEIVIAVGRPEALPADAEAAQRMIDGAGREGVRLVRARVELHDGRGP